MLLLRCAVSDRRAVEVRDPRQNDPRAHLHTMHTLGELFSCSLILCVREYDHSDGVWKARRIQRGEHSSPFGERGIRLSYDVPAQILRERTAVTPTILRTRWACYDADSVHAQRRHNQFFDNTQRWQPIAIWPTWNGSSIKIQERCTWHCAVLQASVTRATHIYRSDTSNNIDTSGR
eukprot:GHRQ01030197.1.p2 GENE.GHRQ01030197.1~~GHRQ01030197.1.p2  ORF type:complete len:177 (+),score=1.95 GHRQ01030197.1:247-777(+)